MLASRGLQFALLTFAVSAAFYARTTLGPLQEAVRVALVLSDNQMALLQGLALSLPTVLAAVPIGLLIDRWTRVRLLVVFAVLNIAGSVLTALAPGFAVMFAARCLVGVTATATGTTAFSLLADMFVPAQRGRASMVIVIGQFAGMSAAFALGGYLLAMPGDVSASAGAGMDAWRWAMLWLASPLVLAIVVTLGMREPARAGVRVQDASIRETFAEVWRYRAVVVPVVVGVVLVEMSLGAAITWAAPALSRTFALGAERVGAIVATGLMVSGVLGPVAGGLLADLSQRSGGPRRTMRLLSVIALLAVPAALFAVADGITAATTLLIAFMTLVSAVAVVGTVLFTIVVPNEVRGLCVAILFAACLLFGLGLAPLAVSLLSGALGGAASIGQSLAVLGAVSSALAAGAFLLGASHLAAKA